MVDTSFFVRCLGFSQDPKTSNFIIVMEFAPLGSLYTYLNNKMTWRNRISALLDISIGLNNLHNSDLIHHDFHPGNLLTTGCQSFAKCAHDQNLVIQICSGIRLKINKQEVPECYINLMKKCLDSGIQAID